MHHANQIDLPVISLHFCGIFIMLSIVLGESILFCSQGKWFHDQYLLSILWNVSPCECSKQRTRLFPSQSRGYKEVAGKKSVSMPNGNRTRHLLLCQQCIALTAVSPVCLSKIKLITCTFFSSTTSSFYGQNLKKKRKKTHRSTFPFSFKFRSLQYIYIEGDPLVPS